MKWVNVINGESGQDFELWENGEKLAGVTFSKHTRFARIVSNLGKRIFSFEKKGFLSAKEIIRNEYGIKMGELEETKSGAGKGYIDLNGVKYNFTYNKNSSGELLVFAESKKADLITCSFDSLLKSFPAAASLQGTKLSSLLLVLCWCSFQSHPPVISATAVA